MKIGLIIFSLIYWIVVGGYSLIVLGAVGIPGFAMLFVGIMVYIILLGLARTFSNRGPRNDPAQKIPGSYQELNQLRAYQIFRRIYWIGALLLFIGYSAIKSSEFFGNVLIAMFSFLPWILIEVFILFIVVSFVWSLALKRRRK